MNTKRKITKIAAQIFAKNGYDRTSIDEIVVKAEIAKGTFYYHFETKEEVFYEIVDQGIKNLIENVQLSINNKNGNRKKIELIIETQTKYFYNHRNICKVIFTQGTRLEKRWQEYINKLKSQYIVIIKNILIEGYKEKIFDIPDTDFMANRIFDTIALASLDGILFSKNKSQQKTVEYTKHFILNGILK